MSSFPKLSILISGNGSNMQAIIEACQNKSLKAVTSIVISSQENAKGIDKAKHHGIETKVCKNDEDILKELIKYQVDLVILAGYMKLIGKTILKAYPNLKIRNRWWVIQG